MATTTEQKIKALKREISYRKEVYPKLTKSGKMTKEQAEHEIAVMQEILSDYEGIRTMTVPGQMTLL